MLIIVIMTLAINTNSHINRIKETHNGTVQLTVEYNHKCKSFVSKLPNKL